MTRLIYPEQPDVSLLWRAVLVSLGLHALVVLLYPSLSRIALPNLPERLEVEFFSMKAAPPSTQPMPPAENLKPIEPTPSKPTPVVKPQTPLERPKQVLAAPASQASDDRVPEQAPPAQTEPAQTTAAPTPPNNVAEGAPHASNASAAKETKASALAPIAQANTESDELSASDSDAWGDYGEQLRSLVSKSKQYPAIAIRRHLEGEAMVVAQFVRGELVNVTLADSSKHMPLDEEAMRMVKKAIAQSGVKDSLKKKSFKITIPVSFKLE